MASPFDGAIALFRAAKIVTSYSRVLSKHPKGFVSLEALREPPDVIRDAIKRLVPVIVAPKPRETLKAGYVSLERFLPAAEWRLVSEASEYARRSEIAMIEVGQERAAAAGAIVARQAEAVDRRLAEFEQLEAALDAG